MGRRLCIIGFCRSIEMLSDVVEDTVLEHGGEVFTTIFSLLGFILTFIRTVHLILQVVHEGSALGSNTISCFLLQPQHLVLLSIERIPNRIPESAQRGS